MNSLIAYAVGLVIISLLGLVAALNFLRYRFKGDKSLVIVMLIATAFVAEVIFTLFQFIPATAPSNQPTFF